MRRTLQFGARVQLSLEGQAAHASHHAERLGTVCRDQVEGEQCVLVRWDGNKHAHLVAAAFVEHAEEER
jgi:hypothetical protein